MTGLSACFLLEQHRKTFSIIPFRGMQRMQSRMEALCAVIGKLSATACYLKAWMGCLRPPFIYKSIAKN